MRALSEQDAEPEADRLFEFYCRPRPEHQGDATRTLYQIWEAGQACGDSITPSTYCPEYRAHIRDIVADFVPEGGHVFSIGCGNAFVEGDLVAAGRRVSAIDWNSEAVDLARAKGVSAWTADIMTMARGGLADYDAVYADGLLGHLYDDPAALDPFFDQLLYLAPPRGCMLVFSNDAPADPGKLAEPHPLVAGFWMLSRELLEIVNRRYGFIVIDSHYFAYRRPLSGMRNRTICIARVDT